MAGERLSVRVIAPEMLDHAPPDVTRASLRDLTRINRYLGGYYVLGRLFDCVVQRGESFSVLDIGADGVIVPLIRTADEARRAVRENRFYGADFIKVVADDQSRFVTAEEM